jgi:hypothetical protein
MVKKWQQSLPALEETYQIQQQSLSRHLPHVRGEMTRHMSRQEQLALSSDKVSSAIPNFVDMSKPEDVASAEQAIMWKKVDAMARQFGSLPGSTHDNALRLRRMRGLLLWDIAHQSIEQREKQEQAATQLRVESGVLGERIAAVQQQIRDATLRTRDDLGQRLAEQTQRIEKIKRLTEDTLEALEKSMQADALALLLANQQTLADQLAEAHLAIARLQDSSVSDGSKQRNES